MVDAARPLQVASLPPALLADAARLLAAGMRDNPLHQQIPEAAMRSSLV